MVLSDAGSSCEKRPKSSVTAATHFISNSNSNSLNIQSMVVVSRDQITVAKILDCEERGQYKRCYSTWYCLLSEGERGSMRDVTVPGIVCCGFTWLVSRCESISSVNWYLRLETLHLLMSDSVVVTHRLVSSLARQIYHNRQRSLTANHQ